MNGIQRPAYCSWILTPYFDYRQRLLKAYYEVTQLQIAHNFRDKIRVSDDKTPIMEERCDFLVSFFDEVHSPISELGLQLSSTHGYAQPV